MFYLGLYREQHEKIFLSETTMPGALIFSMWYQPVDLCQVCSNYRTGAENGPPRGHRFYICFYREKHEKIFLSETTRFRALIFGMKPYMVDLYLVC